MTTDGGGVAVDAELLTRTEVIAGVVAATDEGILALDPAGRVRYANRRFVDLWQLDPRALDRATESEMLHLVEPSLADPVGYRRAVDAARDRPAVDLRDEVRLLDGRVLARRSTPLRDEGGAIVGTVWFFRDVSAEREREEHRDQAIADERAASQIREAFIGVLSHELRTPITTIYGGVKILRRKWETLDPETRATVLDDVDAEADRLFRLVEDLLVLTRAERGNLARGEEPVDLPPIVDRVLTTARAQSPGLVFVAQRDGEVPVVCGDDTYVEQVLRNLVGNAAKYSPPGSIVEVRLRLAGDAVAVRVLDRGPGIDPGEAERLWELFYRSSATARRASGAGIGLFVARRLVEAMDGRTWSQPRAGGGSEFGFALRRYREAE